MIACEHTILVKTVNIFLPLTTAVNLSLSKYTKSLFLQVKEVIQHTSFDAEINKRFQFELSNITKVYDTQKYTQILRLVKAWVRTHARTHLANETNKLTIAVFSPKIFFILAVLTWPVLANDSFSAHVFLPLCFQLNHLFNHMNNLLKSLFHSFWLYLISRTNDARRFFFND